MTGLSLKKNIILFGLIVILIPQMNLKAKETYKAKLKPTLKFKTLSEYQAECKEPSIVLDSDFVIMFAPKKKAREAKIIFGYLVKAYDELYRITGGHTEYKIAVYHFPENNKHGWGGTGNCEIEYSYKSLDLDSQKEWQQYKIPHVSGYIEEMAHSFVHASKIQFGWEMVGWSIGIQTTKKVANNPIFLNNIKTTRNTQRDTFYRYKKDGYVFPKDIPSNVCDRIYAYILFNSETKYGRNFWPDFFKEIRKEYKYLSNAENLGNADKIRNKRYQIAVDCFDRLEGLNFRTMLESAKISLTTDVKALHPTDPKWDRKFISSDPANNIVYDIHSKSMPSPAQKHDLEKIVIDVNALPPLHKAVYGAHSGKTKELIQNGAAINEKGPNGWTPLHIAAIAGHNSMSQYLLKEGADVSIKDNSGRDAAILAEICGHDGLAKFLREKIPSGKN
ncbi:MAG: ankyrin repeat domain-containing protein [Phycisphaerae bacterium]|nr:ankyrin repeat domain-containing protein [Phycisphaerae bacterium]